MCQHCIQAILNVVFYFIFISLYMLLLAQSLLPQHNPLYMTSGGGALFILDYLAFGIGIVFCFVVVGLNSIGKAGADDAICRLFTNPVFSLHISLFKFLYFVSTISPFILNRIKNFCPFLLLASTNQQPPFNFCTRISFLLFKIAFDLVFRSPDERSNIFL